MEDLIINYGQPSKGIRWFSIVYASFLVVAGIILCVTEATYNLKFFLYLFYALTGAIVLLKNTLWIPASTLKITNSTIETKKIKIDWTAVSKVNIGLGYIVFLLNGEQKQQKLDLSELLYKDIKEVKGRIIELCEQKNIPYHND
ncbi:hypothetical protein [Dysgonomonas reticulitermitis]